MMRPENIEDILVRLHNGHWFTYSDKKNRVYENVVVHSGYEKPTKEWLESELKKQQNTYDNDHVRKRLVEYPSIDELVVALWEGVVEERMSAVTALEAVRQAVKTKHPK